MKTTLLSLALLLAFGCVNRNLALDKLVGTDYSSLTTKWGDSRMQINQGDNLTTHVYVYITYNSDDYASRPQNVGTRSEEGTAYGTTFWTYTFLDVDSANNITNWHTYNADKGKDSTELYKALIESRVKKEQTPE